MPDASSTAALPSSIDRVLKLFRSMSREEKMQALVQYSKKLEPLPERFKDLDRGSFTIPECMTRVDIIPEERDGRCLFAADLRFPGPPTTAAVLPSILAAWTGRRPPTTPAFPRSSFRMPRQATGWG